MVSPPAESSRMVIVDYVGNGANDRFVDLGFAPDGVMVFQRGDFVTGAAHLIQAVALGDCTHVFYEPGGGAVARILTNALATAHFQGIAGTGFVTGTNGGQAGGTNVATRLYRVIAWQY